MTQKCVWIDPNESFLNIENVVSAMHQPEAQQAARRRMTTAEVVGKAAIATTATFFESMCT
jgi:hypothetical protein